MKIGWRAVASLVFIGLIVWAVEAAHWLVIDHPQKANAIIVLAGETDARPKLGLKLLDNAYAPVMVLDVPSEQRVFQWTAPDLAQRWVDSLREAPKVRICPIYGLSTKAEAHDAAACLQKEAAKNVLIVTSDYHTRRALSTFRHELPQFRFSVAAAESGQEFGAKWWQHREWAKTTLYEWMRLIWWELVDRWH
jgi:uncharacterized SAM-binding protein YcdF (DUF218 family)